MNKPKLSIIILSWNTKNLLKECLESVSRNIGYRDIGFRKTGGKSRTLNVYGASKSKRSLALEVIVIDNASTDGSREYLKKLKVKSEKLKVVFNKKNLGFAKANNQGIKIAKGEFCLLLNSDTVVLPQALEKLMTYLASHPEVLAVSPLLLNKDKSRQIEYYMKFPSPLRVLLYHNLFFRPLIIKTPLSSLVVSKTGKEKPFAVDQLPGAALMAKASLFKKYPLDEDYPFLFEDVDWCFRAGKKEKGDLLVVPQAKVIHLGGGSWKQWLGENRFSFYKHYFNSLLIFVKKHQPNLFWAYKLVLAFNFLSNGLAHFFLLNFSKAKTQARLLALIIINY